MMDEQQLSPEIYQHLAADRKIEAIKLIREETGLGLADAKELAELLSGREPQEALPPPAMKEEGGAGGILAILAAVLIAFIVYAFFRGD
jgi:hypothetical protein